MQFKITHQCFDKEIICTEDTFPKWLFHKEFLWFTKECVLTLKPNESVKTDFHIITRVS